MSRPSAGQAEAASPGGMEQFIADAISSGWAWSVFGPLSSAGPLAWGIEVSEDAAVKRVERAMSHQPNAAFGGIASGGTEKVCRRNASGGFHWRQV
jgi:hypothetical protein